MVNYRGREIDHRQRLQAEYFRQSLGNGVTLDMVSIPGGTFTMGPLQVRKVGVTKKVRSIGEL